MPEVSGKQRPRSTSSLPAGGVTVQGAGNPGQAHAGKGAAAKLRAAILEGQLRPGAKLSEQVLGDFLGVSRNTLREAFAVLGAERIITRIPNRGVFVAQPLRSDVQEMYRIRLVLEPAALARERTSAMGEAALGLAVQQGLAAQACDDIAGMAGANQQFHALVVGLAGSSRLEAMMAQIQAEMRLVFHAMVSDPAFHAPFCTENASIFALWSGGQGSLAAAEMTRYLEAAQSQVLLAMPGEDEGMP